MTPLACRAPLFGVVVAGEELDEVDMLVRRVQAMNAVDGLLLRPEMTKLSDNEGLTSKSHIDQVSRAQREPSFEEV